MSWFFHIHIAFSLISEERFYYCLSSQVHFMKWWRPPVEMRKVQINISFITLAIFMSSMLINKLLSSRTISGMLANIRHISPRTFYIKLGFVNWSLLIFWTYYSSYITLLAFENLVNNNFHIRRGQTFYCSPKSNWNEATNLQTNSQLIFISVFYVQCN